MNFEIQSVKFRIKHKGQILTNLRIMELIFYLKFDININDINKFIIKAEYFFLNS